MEHQENTCRRVRALDGTFFRFERKGDELFVNGMAAHVQASRRIDFSLLIVRPIVQHTRSGSHVSRLSTHLDWLSGMKQVKIRKRGKHIGVCRVRALISAPLPQVWEFLIKPENMHLWGPLTRPVTGIDRPLQAGDRVTQYRRDFFQHYSQVLLIVEIVPYRCVSMRDLSKAATRIGATATISVEEAKDPEATWIEEAIFYSLGSSRIVQWLDRRLINPLLQLVAGYKTNKAFRRLQAIMASPHIPVSS